MTTIGPIKNPNYDPKDLISSDIDYGRMTHITTSKHLGKDLYVPEIGSASYLKFADDSDEGEIIENERMDVRSLVNRDIASLTKVQKIREVMSYHPKPEEDFEDDSNLSRPRLDLKDVESMSDERYKVPGK